MPASLRATMAPSTAVATPVTFIGTPSSNIFAESANDMSIASTWPAVNVLTRPVGDPGTTVYSACQPRLPRRSCLWMISHAAHPSWRYAKRTLPFPWAIVLRAGTPATSAAPATAPVRRKSRRLTCRPLARIVHPPRLRALGVHQDQRVHSDEPSSGRDQRIDFQLHDPRIVLEERTDRHEDPGQRGLVHGLGSAETPEKRRSPALGEHRPCRVGLERREPDRHVPDQLR